MGAFLEFQTKKSLAVFTEDMAGALKDQGFGVLWSLDFKDKLKQKGHDLEKQVVVFEICNPQLGKQVMETNFRAAYMLPCKVSVIVEEDHLNVGFIKPTALISLLGDESLEKESVAVEHMIESAVKQAL